MTNEEIVLVKKTWRQLRDFNPVVAGDSFYSKLFSKKPSLRRMFPGGMDEHSKELFEMLNLIIARLDQPCLFAEQLEALARKHAHYGITSSQYKMIEEAMLWTVEKALGKDCNKEILRAWKSCYLSIVEKTIAASGAMIK